MLVETLIEMIRIILPKTVSWIRVGTPPTDPRTRLASHVVQRYHGGGGPPPAITRLAV